jgi:hypothetical protein
VDLQKPLQGKISYHIAVVAEDGLVPVKEILNIFQPTCRVEKNWFMTKDNGHTAPLPFRKLFQEGSRQMMGVYNETIHADFQEMIHGISNDGAASDL